MNGIKNPCHMTIEDLQDMLASAPQEPYQSITVPKANCQTVEIYYRKDKDIRSKILFEKQYKERKNLIHEQKNNSVR